MRPGGMLLAGVWWFGVAGPASADLFGERVAPLLSRHCVGCHDAGKKRGGLDLSGRAAALAGGDGGAVIVPGKAADSRLLQAVSGPQPRMPRVGAKLSAGEVAALRRWIDAGAPWPDGVTLRATAVAKEETWWSLRPLGRPAPPAVKDGRWPRTAVDHFLLAALEARGLRPAPEADRRTLIRRVTFDLIGLPPTPDEVDAFLGDTRPDAYERLVDRLLASPHYGERWGRHWLDIAHYGDTHGYDKDKRRDFAWPYRDWVIRALNADLPYRDFVREQLAGDVLRPGHPDGASAVGFVVAGPWDFVGHVELREGTVDKEKTRLIDRDDMVSNALGTFLSLTVGCARCHDHKFDPISTTDYYRLQAVFSGVERGNRRLPGGPAPHREKLLAEKAKATAERDALRQQAAAGAGPALAEVDAELTKRRAELATLPAPAAPRSRTNGYHSAIEARPDAVKWVQIDLGAAMPIDDVRLFPARPVDFRDAPGFGFPARFRVEVSDEADFRAPRLLADHMAADFANPGDHPVILSAKGQKGRHVRVTATRLWKRLNDYVFALAEVQVVSAGKNVALGRPVTARDSIEAGLWARRHLVDGFDSRHKLPEPSDAAARQRLQLLGSIRELERRRAARIAAVVPAALQRRLADAEKDLAALERRLAQAPAGPMVYSVVPIRPRPIWVLHRGDVEQRRRAVTPGGLRCVEGPATDFTIDRPDDEGQRRLALADWVADARNPLRVCLIK